MRMTIEMIRNEEINNIVKKVLDIIDEYMEENEGFESDYCDLSLYLEIVIDGMKNELPSYKECMIEFNKVYSKVTGNNIFKLMNIK